MRTLPRPHKIALLFILLLSSGIALGQENPFTGGGIPEPGAALELGAVGDFFMGIQTWFNKQIGEQLTLDPENRQAGFLFGILGITFLYGIFHSLGPGHRKTVLFSWIVARTPSVPSIFGVSALLSFFHFLGTGLIILLAAAARDILGRSLSESQDTLQLIVQSISAVAVAILGVVLLRQAFTHSHSHDHAHGGGNHDRDEHGHSHSHGHERVEDGRGKGNHERADIETRSEAAAAKASEPKSMFLVAISQGLVPCPGSLSILAVSLILGDIGVGLAAVLSISLGMLATLFVLGLAVRFLLRGVDLLGSRGGKVGLIVSKIMQGLQVSAAILVLVYGVVWLGAGIVELSASLAGG